MLLSTESSNDILKKVLFSLLVSNSMMHGPCGLGFPNAPCMKDGKCSKGYPKEYREETILANEK